MKHFWKHSLLMNFIRRHSLAVIWSWSRPLKKTSAASFAPVSYTHLDGYKRQVELSFLKKDEQKNLFATMESEEATPSLSPVSYTHLGRDGLAQPPSYWTLWGKQGQRQMS